VDAVDFRSTVSQSFQGPEFLSGTIAGRFLIGECLGKGGMGEVYRARDTKLKRTVALKRLAPHLRADPEYRLKFQAEATRSSRFSDPHIASMYDVFEAQGEIFLVMEYVEGETLRLHLQRGVKLEQFFDVAMQCSEALIAAHEQGIVHCDIKPENIMLTSHGQVKILDFGVAKHLPRSDRSSTMGDSNLVAGTPAYMSPEVLLEKIPDGRADIFSLGVVFYELLTCRQPFLAGSFIATADRIRHEIPASIQVFNSEVPPTLSALVDKAMAKRPEQRQPTARELLRELRLAKGASSQDLHPIKTKRNFARWGLGALLAALLGGAVFTVIKDGHSSPILQERGWVLISDFETRGDDQISDTGVREGLNIALQQSRYVNVFPRARVYEVMQRMKKGSITRIDEDLGREICRREDLQVLLTGYVERVGGVFQITVQATNPVDGNLLFAEKERFDRKDQFFEKADELAKKVRKDLGESLTKIEATSRPLAKVTTSSLEALQLYSTAKDAMDQAKLEQVQLPVQAALRLDPEFAMAHRLLGDYFFSIVGKNEKGLAEYQRAYDLRQAVTDRERLWVEASFFSAQERYEDALQSLAMLVRFYPDDLDAHLALADTYDSVARPGKAIEELRQVLRINPQSVTVSARLVLYLARSNADQEALTIYENARQRGLDSSELHRGAGFAYLGLGKVGEARKQFEKVEQSGESYKDVGEFSLAKVDIYEGKLASARARLAAIIQRDQVTQSKGLQLVCHSLLGRIYLVLEQPILARHQAEEILAAPSAYLQATDMVSAGTLYARTGALKDAARVVRRLELVSNEAPSAWNKRSVLALQAEIALAEGALKEAVQGFKNAATTYPQASDHVGLAVAYERQKDWRHAGEQWQEVLNLQGDVQQEEFPADLALAYLHLARGQIKLRDEPGGRRNYEQFLELWRNGDNLRQRSEAGAELRALEEKSKKQGT
jgi:serine/threonine protein kinase/tetratricopeptide (TPR) repeat protein